MSIECCEKQMVQLELYSKLATAISEIKQGAKGAGAGNFLKYLRDEIKVPVIDSPITYKSSAR